MTKLTTWQATIQNDDTGAAVVSPVVTVRLGGPAGAIADLFDLAGSPIANPVTGGTDGFVQFQMRPGRYWVQAADGGTFSNAWYVDAVPEEGLNWATRSELVADVSAGMNLPDGTIVSDGTVQYVASVGATDIADLNGWLPFGDVTPLHWGADRLGVSDSSAAVTAAYLFWTGTSLGNQHANPSDKALEFPSGYLRCSGVTITTNGTGQVIRGQGQVTSRLGGVDIVINDRHCSVEGLSLTDSGTYGIRLASTSRRTAIVRDVHVRDHYYGVYMEAGADDTFTDCVFEKNVYNLFTPDETGTVHAVDCEFTSCKFLSANVNNIYAPTGELKFSNCVQGNASSVGMIVKSRNSGATSSVECYFSQMTHTAQGVPSFKSITAVADAGGGNITITCDNNFRAGETVEIFGTTDYNGSVTVVSATDTTFTVAGTFTSSQTGVVRRLHDRVWRITAVADNGGGEIVVTTDGDHELTPKMTGIVISGTSDYDGTYDVVDVLASNQFVVTAAFVSSQTGIGYLENWDVVIDGEGTIGRVNDMFFTGCNINYLKIKDAYNITFTGTRLKEQIFLAGNNDRIMFVRSRRGRNSDTGSFTDIPVSGPTSNQGWSEVATSDVDNVAGDDDTNLVMAVPNLAAGVGANSLPSLNEMRVTPSGFQHSIAGAVPFETTDGGIKQVIADLGPNLVIVSGAITPTHSFHRVLAEGTVADQLTSIAAGSFPGQILILENLSNIAPITVIDDSAARLEGDFVLNDARAVLGLYWDGSEWGELFRKSNGTAQQWKLPKTTVASLSSLINVEEGDQIYVTDLRVYNGTGTLEGAGLGTGGLATYNGSNWVIAGTNSVASA